MSEHEFRRVFEVECNNGSVVNFAPPLFEDRPDEALYFVDTKRFAEALRTRVDKSSKPPVFDGRTGLPVIEGGARQRHVAALFENSADVPVPLPLVDVNYSKIQKIPVIEVLNDSADILSALMRMGARTIPMRVSVGLKTADHYTDLEGVGQLIGATGPAAELSQYRLYVDTDRPLPADLGNQHYSNKVPVSHLALFVDCNAWKLPVHNERLDKASLKEEALRPDGAHEFNIEMREKADELDERDPDIMQRLEFLDEMQQEIRRRFRDVPPGYGKAFREQARELAKVERLEGLDLATEYLDHLVAAGVHGVSIPSPNDGRGIVSALEPVSRAIRHQLTQPTGSPEALLDRFSAVVDRLKHRIFDHDVTSNASMPSVQRLQELAVPLGRAVIDKCDVRLIARDLSTYPFAITALKWIGNNPNATHLESWGLTASPTIRAARQKQHKFD